MKGISKLLYFILGLVIAMCALILLCEANPELSKAISSVTKGLIPVKETTVEEAAAEESSVEEAAADEASAEASSDTFNFIFTEETQDAEETEEEEEPLSYDDATKKRDLTDNVYTDTVEGYSQSDADDPYKKLIEDGLDDDVFSDDYFSQFVDKNDYTVTEPIVYDITDDSEAQEIVDNTGYGETGEDAEFDSLYYPYYAMLGDKGKRLYKQIYANSNALIPEFKPIEECTPNEWIAAFDCVFYDHPELFWMDIANYYEYDYKGNVIKAGLIFYDEIADVAKAKIRFNKRADELLSPAKSLSSEYEKEKYIHDLLVDKITYQHNSMDQSSFSSIPNDYTVCCGYAKAFQYLMQKLEVPTYFCIGWGGEMHAWNIIKLEDGYYNVDCTWDDTDPSTYDFFNVTDKNNLRHSRMYQSRYLPPCNGSKYSGLEKEELDLSGFEVDSDNVYTDYLKYVKDLLSIVAKKYKQGEKDITVKLAISQDMFMEWYLYNYDDNYGDENTGSQLYNDDDFTLILAYDRLSNGDYMITHTVNFKE